MLNKKVNLLFIHKTQFGYHTDNYMFCTHLSSEYSIKYICFDSGFKKLAIKGVEITYVSYSGNKTIRGIRFLFRSILYLARYKGIIFITYFERCEVLKRLYFKKKMILDIRTLSINQNSKQREKEDFKLIKSARYFDHLTFISDKLRVKLKIPKINTSVLPLGAEIINDTDKSFDKIHLLYVGTLNGRNVHHTILGLKIFLDKHPKIEISYDIVGDGSELSELITIVQELKLNTIVKIHGRVPHFELKPFFEKCNVGISYIPITDFYNFQPPTKTFEYILSGMPCIATSTHENSKLITKDNGFLCQDNPISFSEALEILQSQKKIYNSFLIRKSLIKHTWKEIVNLNLKPILNNF